MVDWMRFLKLSSRCLEGTMMIKLILTDMDGTFFNSEGDFNRKLF